jgi:hypothetical protein
LIRREQSEIGENNLYASATAELHVD